MASYDELVAKSHKRSENRKRAYLSDGLIIVVLRLLFRPAAYYHSRVFVRSIKWLKPHSEHLAELLLHYRLCHTTPRTATAMPSLAFKLALDIYMMFMTTAICVAYSAVFYTATNTGLGVAGYMVLVLGSLVCAIRGYEIMSFVVLLHTKTDYYSAVPMRALVNTLWHYGEIVVVFATLYVSGAAFGLCGFHGCLRESFETPLYFSLITVATVGYGDIYPESFLSRCLVSLEIVCGIMLLVVALQRVLASKRPPRRPAK